MTYSQEPVAHINDFSGGHDLQHIRLGDHQLVLCRVGNGDFHAVSAHCPHYGAPLAQGTLRDYRLTCPWHMATFDVTTGDLLQPPALDGLPHYEVRIEEDGSIYVEVPETRPDPRPMPMCGRDPSDERLFAILGGGAAAQAAAEALRQHGYGGRILIISRERRQPYDRTICSKAFLDPGASESTLPLRDEAFFRDHDIEFLTAEITGFDVAVRKVTLAHGQTLQPDQVLIATGGLPVRPNIPGSDNSNVMLLRTPEDAKQIRERARQVQNVVIVGGSFIGMETAAQLVEQGKRVTVVERSGQPFEGALGSTVGQIMRRFHERHGTQFRSGMEVTAIHGAGRHEHAQTAEARQVELSDGSRLDAELVILGVGIRPATDYLSNVEQNPDGSVSVDEQLRLADGVFAAGDVANYPDPHHSGQRLRVEHWRVAQQHGRTAGLVMAGMETTFTGVPFFWTRHFGVSFDYIGYADDFDDVILRGDTEGGSFSAYYFQGEELQAIFGTETDQIHAFLELRRTGEMPQQSQCLGDRGEIDLTEHLHAIKH